MRKEKFTPTPNILFDQLLKEISYSELKVLLVIIRQTNGWVIKKTKKRKTRDRITYNQFSIKTGLSRRIISKTINSLSQKQLIRITDFSGNLLNDPQKRKGKTHIYYSSNLEFMQKIQISTCANDDTNMCTLRHQPVQNMVYNKINLNKIKKTKERENELKSMKQVIDEKYF